MSRPRAAGLDRRASASIASLPGIACLGCLLITLAATGRAAPANAARPVLRRPYPLQQIFQAGDDEEEPVAIPQRWPRPGARPLPPWREPLELRHLVPSLPPEARRAGPARALELTSSLGADALVSSREPPTCTRCNGLPIAQDEPSAGLLGDHVLVSFNEMLSKCLALGFGRQDVSYSLDGGRTFTNMKAVTPFPELPYGLSGDPSVAVNARTGEFYMAGFGSSPQFILFGTSMGIARGHFSDTSFVFDDGRVCASGIEGDFWDKPWMTVDSLSGNVYLTWTVIPGDNSAVSIGFRRLDASLQPLADNQTVIEPDTLYSPQFPMPIVGPDGELYVGCWEATNDGVFQSRIVVRRSNDQGATFGPPTVVTTYDGNLWNGAPGMLRSFGPMAISWAVDRSRGPHRGRLYVAWDQALTHLAHTFSDSTSAIELEPNGTPDAALEFVPGGKLRGSVDALESDFFRFGMRRGQTFFIKGDYDTTQPNCMTRLWARETPTSPLRLVANASGYAGGMLFTAPADGEYLLEIYGVSSQPNNGRYALHTDLLWPQPGDLARDHRDQMVAWSDDGSHWSAPRRVNDSPPGYDGIYPTLAVDGRGRVHCFWLDFREDTLTGSHSVPYMASSGDGGVTWGPNRRLGDALSGWPLDVCLSNGNTQGDYLHAATDGNRVVSVFTDSRLGDPDIFADVSESQLLAAAPDRLEYRETTDSAFALALVNRGNYPRTLSWRLEDAKGWVQAVAPGPTGARDVAPGETLSVAVVLRAQACLGDSEWVRLIATDPYIPGAEDSSVTLIRCGAGPAPPASPTLALARISPNPANAEFSVDLSLPDDSPARLELFDLQGRLVMSQRLDGFGAGPHVVQVRTPAGLRAGLYSLRLRHGSRRLQRTVVIVR